MLSWNGARVINRRMEIEQFSRGLTQARFSARRISRGEAASSGGAHSCARASGHYFIVSYGDCESGGTPVAGLPGRCTVVRRRGLTCARARNQLSARTDAPVKDMPRGPCFTDLTAHVAEEGRGGIARYRRECWGGLGPVLW